MSLNMLEACGTDSKARNGSNTERKSLLNQASQEDERFADPSISCMHLGSQPFCK